MVKNSQVLPKDKNNNSIQSGSGFLLNDGGTVGEFGTQINSPVGSGTSDVALVWPLNAIKLYVYLPTENGRLKQGSNYITIPKQQFCSIPGLPSDSVVIGRPSSTALEFAFEILG